MVGFFFFLAQFAIWSWHCPAQNAMFLSQAAPALNMPRFNSSSFCSFPVLSVAASFNFYHVHEFFSGFAAALVLLPVAIAATMAAIR